MNHIAYTDHLTPPMFAPVTTIPGTPTHRIPDRVKRQWDTGELNRVWISDITYLRTGEGWLYLCVGACQVFCVSDLVFGLQVGVDSFGVGQSELLEGLFPVGGHGAFDESTFGCAFRASPEPSFFGAVTGPFVLDVADCQP